MNSLFAALRALGSAITAGLALFYYNWALIYARWGQAHRAFWYMNRAVRMSPNNPKMYYHRASLFLAMGSPERAIQDYDEAIRIDPGVALAYANRAFVYTVLGNDAAAQQDIDRAVELGFDRDWLDQIIRQIIDQR